MEHSGPNAVVNLADLGWSDFFAQSFRPLEARGLTAGRIVAQHRGVCRAVFAQGELPSEVSGRFRHSARHASSFPVIGDWIAAQVISSEGKAVIQEVLPRRTKFSRTAPGDAGEEQVLAANIDDVFVVEALSGPLNLRRLERFLALAWESGAQPTVLLTKSDLCGDIRGAVAQAEAVAAGAGVCAVSSVNGRGMARVNKLVKEGRTAALLGPSGVGKSTLINQLCTEAVQFVQPVRESDHKGRHTTTEREIISLPNGGLIIDTPGLRELQLWEGAMGVREGFADIEALARGCRFSDCRHENEPGCAVLGAVQSGEIEMARLESHRKLMREAERFERRQDQRKQAEAQRRTQTLTKALRARLKEKGRDED